MPVLIIGDDAVRFLGLEMTLPYPRAYQTLFIALLGLLVLYPVLAIYPPLDALTDLFVGLVLVAAALASATNGTQFRITMGIAALGFVLGFGASLLSADVPALGAVGRLYGLAFLAYVAWHVLHDVVMVNRRVNAHMIYGALCVYLLIGLTFAFAFSALESVVPGAIAGLDEGSENRTPLGEFTYFSFVSLTTLGFGDFYPVSPLARTLSYSEAIIGQIYLTVVLARLVALYVAESRHD
ncbi:MAG: potassium channel family protein [Pseudomonadales bacterium]|jgi:hypothetical protein|nr:potassium channel family protein [Pseudomonadales bacterium]